MKTIGKVFEVGSKSVRVCASRGFAIAKGLAGTTHRRAQFFTPRYTH